jgi:hypothetical protein
MRWWQPRDSGIPGLPDNPRNYWPNDTPGDAAGVQIADVLAALQTVGYESFDLDPSVSNDGYEVAVLLHIKSTGVFCHACLWLGGETWRSKCGDYSDLSHDLQEIRGGDYGSDCIFVRRPRLAEKGAVTVGLEPH